MLATMGCISPEITGALPGYLFQSAGLKFVDIPCGFVGNTKVASAGWAHFLASGAFCELSQYLSVDIPAAARDSGFEVLLRHSTPQRRRSSWPMRYRTVVLL